MGGGGQPECRYVPRAPQTVLQRAVREGLAELLDEAEAMGGLPAFILKEVRGLIGCGDLRRGFVRVKCSACGEETRVGFSCKARNLCPSCTAKRAALTAAHLVDEVLPAAPWRQWTLAFPRALKLALAIDASLLSAALNVLVHAIFAWQRRQAKALGVDVPLPGAVAFVQYFSGALLLHPHFHVLCLTASFNLPTTTALPQCHRPMMKTSRGSF